MPCKYVITMDGKIVVERWEGTVTLDELIAHKQQQALNPSIKEGAAVLSDCTRATFQISPDAIGKLSAIDNDPNTKKKITRYAFLVNNDTYDRAQQFSNQVNRDGKSVIIFNSLDVACKWLGIDPMEVHEVIKSAEN